MMKWKQIGTMAMAAVLSACSFRTLPVSVSAVESSLMLENCDVYDEADVLTDEEEAELDALVQETAQTIDMNLFVRLGAEYTYSEGTARSYAEDDYAYLFGDDKYSAGVSVYIDFHGAVIQDTSYAPHDYIYTHGLAQLYYTNSEEENRIQRIFDSMNSYLQRGEEEPVDAVEQLCSRLKHYYEEGIPKNYYVYDNMYEEYFYIDKDGTAVWSAKEPPAMRSRKTALAFGISFLIGLVIALITLFGTWHHYQFKSAPTAAIYTNRDAIAYGARMDRFRRSYRRRVKVESSSRSGGGGGGGGSSSGGGGGGGNSR